jgi:hypothetical protein
VIFGIQKIKIRKIAKRRILMIYMNLDVMMRLIRRHLWIVAAYRKESGRDGVEFLLLIIDYLHSPLRPPAPQALLLALARVRDHPG